GDEVSIRPRAAYSTHLCGLCLQRRELLDVGRVAADDDEVVVRDDGVRRRIGELGTGRLHADHGDVVLLAHPGFAERDAADRLRWVHLHDREVIVELDEVEHAARDEVSDAFAGLRLGIDDVVRADAGENLAVRLADRLRPDLRDLEVDEVRGDEHARFDRRAHGHDRDREVLRADLAQGVDAARVGLYRVGHSLRPLLHEVRVLIDSQNLAVEPVELPGGTGAEATETDDQHGGVVRDALNQRWASLLRFGTTGGVGWLPAPRRGSLYQLDLPTSWPPG